MKNILVTGGTSYIGKHCIAQLIEKDIVSEQPSGI